MDSIGRQPENWQDPIAIVGLACRLPGNCNSPTAFWNFLVDGGCAKNEPPSSRFNLGGHFDGSSKPGTMRSPGGMFLEDIDLRDIDARFFALSQADAVSIDPQQRQLLETVYEGLENAGITLEMLKGKAYGCFVGSYASDYTDIQGRDPEDRTPSWTVGSGRAMLSNRISHFFDLKGPSMTIDTACSGSLISIDLACRYLQTHDADGAIVAGCNLYMSPEHNMDQSAIRASASPTGRCHTFDAKADGYIKAEAVNMLVLKRLDDAIRDENSIRAIIRGSSTNSDGWTPGIASPSSEAQAIAIRKAYAKAGISDFRDTSYLECHGTGTQAGDPIEVQGVASVFSETRDSEHPLIIGSVKSNIGHSEPAAGISGLLKTVLALENGVIPGNPTFEMPNPSINFQSLKVRVSKATIKWPSVPLRRASVNSFGYGGSNAHVIVDETSALIESYRSRHVSSYGVDSDYFFAEEDTQRPRVLLFSANDDISLKSYIKSIVRHLINPRVCIKLHDLAYTLSERRTRHFRRAYVVAKDLDFNENSFQLGRITPNAPDIGFVFTGQGAQWSQMGKGFIETFPIARLLLKSLDNVLQGISNPPNWSLLDELMEPRSSEHLRLPEYSQPLTTALQLAILAVLSDWGLHPKGVVGHSSGEIAAAVAAGYLTPEEAIKVAYLRGRAAVDYQNHTSDSLGMLALGLGSDDARTYLSNAFGSVQIACINSPNSVTLSGRVIDLEKILLMVKADGYFARLLQVNLAYHSNFMTDIAAHYRNLLSFHCELPPLVGRGVVMYSSVTGQRLDGDCDFEYWQKNMTSPVLFQHAVEAMVSEGSIKSLIEIGPSDTLSGPIAQIRKALGSQGTDMEYCVTSRRGPDAVDAIFDVAGQMFLSGSSINMSKVNGYEEFPDKPSLIVDLPNYKWNHTIKYWYESEASRDWRFKTFPIHDLLGSKIIGTPWHTPLWKKVLRTSDVPWLKDHKIGESILFPAAGYMAMAIEALYQMSQSLGYVDEAKEVFSVSYRLRNVAFQRALILGEEGDHKIFSSLTPCTARSVDSWYEFTISSLKDNVRTEHCRGLISLLIGNGEAAPEGALNPLKYGVPSDLWYKALGDIGYNFGLHFRKQLEVESVAGRRHSRVLLSFSDPPSTYHQSCYPIHPACIDGCLQSGVPSLWQGYRSSIDTALVPAIIDDLVVHSRTSHLEKGMAVSSSEYTGTGRLEEAKNYKSHVCVYDMNSGLILLQMSGLHYNKLETDKDRHGAHKYTRLSWRPDISFLTQEHLNYIIEKQKDPTQSKISSSIHIEQVIEMIAHKNPNLAVMEVNMVSSSSSTWLDSNGIDETPRAACRRYLFTSNTSSSLVEAQEKYQQNAVIEYDICDITKHPQELPPSGTKFDLIILKLPFLHKQKLHNAMENARNLLSHGGYILLMHCNPQLLDSGSESSPAVPWKHLTSDNLLPSISFHGILNIPVSCSAPDGLLSAHLLSATMNLNSTTTTQPSLSLVTFSDTPTQCNSITQSMVKLGWHVTDYHYTAVDHIPVEDCVLVLDEISSPVLPTIQSHQWEALQKLISSQHKILWVTAGSQFDVSDPYKALFHGLARSARAEDPSLVLKTLDVESDNSDEATEAIHKILTLFKTSGTDDRTENEYCQRQGIIYMSRILLDGQINGAERDRSFGSAPKLKSFHGNPLCVNMRCERQGTIDSLNFSESSTEEIPLEADFVEVEIHAAGVNYKDVAVTMGIVPENQYRLGFEGAGVIRRLGKSVHSYTIGDRVLVDSKGCFANRVQAPVEAIHLLPDSMSFEEAATLCVVYLTSIHALLDLANLQQGQSVLIHSAAGGLGIAAIQICKHVGAEIYATAGSEEKRRFLTDSFEIPHEHIFSSRDKSFAPNLMRMTNNKGVNVVLNFLTGDLLDQSWRCIADRGVMLELGKKDILDRGTLSMEPFGRNASYRALDMSHPSITPTIIAELLTRMFTMIAAGHIKPILPVKVFSFNAIPDALRYMRGGSHIGKIVISDGATKCIEVSTRSSPRALKFRTDLSYLIVGGLKGLCGSLAVYLARKGAKYLTVLSRSGYEDEKSQAVLQDLDALGVQTDLFKGDVSKLEDVQRMFRQSKKPIVGIIQGAMVLRDKTFPSMTVEDFHETIRSKVQGTWNLHTTALSMNLSLDFFTLLSSISGIIGQKGQANYAAANVFLDSFAAYRRKLDLPACSVDLGVIEDVGYISERQSIAGRLEKRSWGGINESLLHKILEFSIFQQQTPPISPASAAQIITGIPVPQAEESELLLDPRFRALCFGNDSRHLDAHGDGDSVALNAFSAMVKAKADRSTLLVEAVALVNKQFTKSLGLSEPIEPGRPFMVYGVDSLAAVELRNWVRGRLGAEVTTLEILNASSLTALCERILEKLGV